MSGVGEAIALKLGLSCLGSCLCGACSDIKNSCRATHEGILIPKGCLKSSLRNNLTSESISFVDLDFETKQDVDEDHDKLDHNSSLYLTRLYNDCQKIVDEIASMNEVSNKLKTIVFISSDYKLLKYVNANQNGIDYFIPSDAFHDELKKNDGWDESKFQILRTDLIARKSSKLKIFTGLADLLNQVCAIYPDAKIKI